MESKSLLYGLIGFFLGGLVVSVAATTFERPEASHGGMANHMSMPLENTSGDEYDKAFIGQMIEHHQSAIDMARLSEDRAKHDEIKKLSDDIISTQQAEIDRMEQWRAEWGY